MTDYSKCFFLQQTVHNIITELSEKPTLFIVLGPWQRLLTASLQHLFDCSIGSIWCIRIQPRAVKEQIVKRTCYPFNNLFKI